LVKASDDNDPIGWFMASERLSRLTGLGGGLSAHFTQASKPAIASMNNLISNINTRVYNLYSSLPDKPSISQTWVKLLNDVLYRMTSAEVFTTNYDLVIEAALEQLKLEPDNANISVRDGRVGTIVPKLELSQWEKDCCQWEIKKIKYAQLTKLHGSIDWSNDGDTIYTGNPQFKGDHSKHVILYPGFKGKPESEPFITFHNHLANALRVANGLIFIGFAFRDEYINNILERYTPATTKIIVVDLEKLPEAIPYPEDRISFIPGGFNAETVSKIKTIISH